MNIETNQLKYEALIESVYCPPFKEDNAIETIDLNEFEIEACKESIKNSIALLSYDKSYKPLIIEILDILDRNKFEFLLEQHKCIAFYWNGILILRINIKKEVMHNKVLHISLQKYKNEKEHRISDKKTNRILMAGLGGVLLIGTLIAGVTLFKSKN